MSHPYLHSACAFSEGKHFAYFILQTIVECDYDGSDFLWYVLCLHIKAEEVATKFIRIVGEMEGIDYPNGYEGDLDDMEDDYIEVWSSWDDV